MTLVLTVPTAMALIAAADDAVRSMANEIIGGEQAGKGGVFRAFCLTDPFDYTGLVTLTGPIWVGGEKNAANERRYEVISFEKVIRLAINHRDRNHISSHQSRIDGYLYGGAILFGVWSSELGRENQVIILSFSGLPELGDEAAMVMVAEKMGQELWHVARDDLESVLRASSNPHYRGELTAR